MNVYRMQVFTHHNCTAVVVVAESEEEAIRVAKEQVNKEYPFNLDQVGNVELIPLDVKQAYVLAEWGF